jgi:hypothetical protein
MCRFDRIDVLSDAALVVQQVQERGLSPAILVSNLREQESATVFSTVDSDFAASNIWVHTQPAQLCRRVLNPGAAMQQSSVQGNTEQRDLWQNAGWPFLGPASEGNIMKPRTDVTVCTLNSPLAQQHGRTALCE